MYTSRPAGAGDAGGDLGGGASWSARELRVRKLGILDSRFLGDPLWTPTHLGTMDLGILPLKIRNLTESKPPKSRFPI